MASHLLALQTATPPYALPQDDVASLAPHLFGASEHIAKLLPVFTNTGIRTRFSCVPLSWYQSDHGWAERNRIYLESALGLLEDLTKALLKEACLQPCAVDAIVVVSTTGIATPSLDALLMERMTFRRDVARLPIFGLGCAGGVTGLARAADLATARPGANVLFLVVELCALSFRKKDFSKSNIVATALFGDGAAGALISTKGEGPRIEISGEHTWPHSLDIMGWDVEEDGLKARFAQNIPDLVAKDFRSVLDNFLVRSDLRLSDFDRFACHPGGAKVLDALEMALNLHRGDLVESREILRDFGNMSAATVLFVLAHMEWRKGRTLLTALGPGFSAAFLSLCA